LVTFLLLSGQAMATPMAPAPNAAGAENSGRSSRCSNGGGELAVSVDGPLLVKSKVKRLCNDSVKTTKFANVDVDLAQYQ